MSEVSSRLRARFGDCDWLSAEQVAGCLDFSRNRVCQLCAAADFPLHLEVREGHVRVAADDFAGYVDRGFSAETRVSAAPEVLVLIRLFQAQLRAEIFRLELIRAAQALVAFADRLVLNAQDLDERCVSEFEMSKTVLKAQASALASGLAELVNSTQASLNLQHQSVDTPKMQ